MAAPLYVTLVVRTKPQIPLDRLAGQPPAHERGMNALAGQRIDEPRRVTREN